MDRIGGTMRAESRRRPIAAGKTREMAEVTPMVAMAMLREQGAGCVMALRRAAGGV